MSTTGRIGIKEVAAAAGVSVTTVSHALNGKGRLPEETRQHVRRVAEQLAYRPSPAARNLGGRKTGLLGLLISQPPGSSVRFSDFAYFTELMMAASTTAMKAGYALVLTTAEHALGASLPIPLDGALIIDPVGDDALVAELIRSETPIVTTGRILGDHADRPWVDNDHAAGVRSVLTHLSRRGARRIALLSNPAVMSYTADVEAAYRAWCLEQSMTPLVRPVGADLTESAGYAAARKLLSLKQPPDAIYATYDRVGVGALLAARAAGIAVPNELLLAVTATGSGGEPTRPSLTGLSLHPDQIGARAAELLIDLVEERTPPSLHVIVPTRLVPRTSTKRLHDAEAADPPA
ncbi:MAG: LacI family DNA-binding transcriptional regulator [Solirubrobacteraceae bacterium]